MAEFGPTPENQIVRTLAITGGAGFIGSNLCAYMLPRYPDYKFVIVDCLTYAGSLHNLQNVSDLPNFEFEQVDIRDRASLLTTLEKHEVDGIIHLAAESHVDRSIADPAAFITTNLVGTFNLLEYTRSEKGRGRTVRFHHVSTDEVFGSLETGEFTENSPYNPSSPYSATKAGADHLVRAYYKTYGVDCVISGCSNNYGPFQFPEKLIPLVIRCALNDKEIPVYGDGAQKRDWLFVNDHCRALDVIFHGGMTGETYLVGGNTDISNIELVKVLCSIIEAKTGKQCSRLIKFVKDRPAHDRRYSVDFSKLNRELGWEPFTNLEEGLEATVDWYLHQSERSPALNPNPGKKNIPREPSSA